MRDPEPDADRVLTEFDARMATGHSIEELRAQAAWVATPKPIPAELTPEFHAVPYTPPAATFFPPLMGRIDQAMRERLTDLYGGI